MSTDDAPNPGAKSRCTQAVDSNFSSTQVSEYEDRVSSRSEIPLRKAWRCDKGVNNISMMHVPLCPKSDGDPTNRETKSNSRDKKVRFERHLRAYAQVVTLQQETMDGTQQSVGAESGAIPK